MSKTIGQIKEMVLHNIAEASNSGEANDSDSIKDYKYRIIPLINTFMPSIARDSRKIHKTYEIAHNMPENQLGVAEWKETNVHITTNDDNDVSFSALGSQAYSFQVEGYATVYVEEETSTDVWTTLFTITHTPTAGEGYVTYKGLTGVSDTTNYVRLRFGGSYRYAYKWVALFADLFYSADYVPKYEPYVPYDMPADFYMLERVQWTHANLVYEDYANYRIEEHSGASKRISVYWYDIGEFKIEYIAYPTYIENVELADLDAKDATVIDLPDEACSALVLMISSSLLELDEQSVAIDMRNMGYMERNALNANDTGNQRSSDVIDVYNW